MGNPKVLKEMKCFISQDLVLLEQKKKVFIEFFECRPQSCMCIVLYADERYFFVVSTDR